MAKGWKIVFFLLLFLFFFGAKHVTFHYIQQGFFHSFPYIFVLEFQLFCAQVDRGGILGTSAMHTATVAKSLAVPFASPVTIGDSDLMWFYPLEISEDYVFLGTNGSPTKVLLNIIFLSPGWDMLVPWSIDFTLFWGFWVPWQWTVETRTTGRPLEPRRISEQAGSHLLCPQSRQCRKSGLLAEQIQGPRESFVHQSPATGFSVFPFFDHCPSDIWSW